MFIYIYIYKRRPSANSTKVWLLSNGSILLANNNSKIPEKELKHVMLAIQANYDEIIQYWMAYHGYITYYR